MAYIYPHYEYVKPPKFEQDARVSAVIVGAGLVGLTLALDLAQHGVSTIVIDEDDTVSEGSRAIVFGKRSLEIYDRLGLGQKLLAKGVSWNIGKVFSQDQQLFEYNFLPEEDHEYPAFLNLQQYYIEEWLIDACLASELIDIRWRNRAIGVDSNFDHTVLTIETPDGNYRLITDWLLACDGARSFIRNELGLPFVGKEFPSHFLIADVIMNPEFPAERRFWFNPQFHPGQSVLLHKQPNNVWRVDFQLGLHVDVDKERKPEHVLPRLQAMFGPNVPFDLEWVSIYSFRSRRLTRFVHERVIFVGDSAHQVSPFGGRGGNGGIQDADNLAWKLAAVIQRNAPMALIESYNEERIFAADENILNSSRSAEFITPNSEAAYLLREAVLKLSEHHEFARRLVNSGRLSVPAILQESTLMQSKSNNIVGKIPVGSPAVDAPVEFEGESDWLLHYLGKQSFTLLGFDYLENIPKQALTLAQQSDIPVRTLIISPESSSISDDVTVLWDKAGVATLRYGIKPGAFLLVRPDQHIAAAFESFDLSVVEDCLRLANGEVEASRVPADEDRRSSLILEPQLEEPDALFALIADAYVGLDLANVGLLNAQILLLLANHIGSIHVVEEAVSLAQSYISSSQGEVLDQVSLANS